MAKEREKPARPAKHEPRPRTPFSSSDAALCSLLLLAVAGVATQAIELDGNVRLLMLVATGLSLLVGIWRPRIWATIPAILIVAGGAVVAAYFIEAVTMPFFWIGISGAIVAGLGFGAIWVSSSCTVSTGGCANTAGSSSRSRRLIP